MRTILARVLTHIPQPNQHSILYYGLYARRTRKPTGNKRQHTTDDEDNELDKAQRKTLRRRWANLIRRVFKTDPLICQNCGGKMRIISFITEPSVIGEDPGPSRKTQQPGPSSTILRDRPNVAPRLIHGATRGCPCAKASC
jgi:hypothetical protein